MKTEGSAAGGYYATAIGEIFIHSYAKNSEYMLALFHQPEISWYILKNISALN